jgi:acetylornithine deacetylase/succinyl-diaminopimelate desuccinylase-like protein
MSTLTSLTNLIDRKRLTDRALAMVSIPSPTGRTREVATYFSVECAAVGADVEMLDEIPDAPEGADAPSVAAWWRFSDGPTLQFDGHTDTIETPHTPAELRDEVLYGRGAVDMKASVAAAIEMMAVLRDANVSIPGSILLTTHGLHEAPLGHGEGLRALVEAGHRGDDAVVVEGPIDTLAIVGRGMAIWNATVSGPNESTHENETPKGTPNPLAGAAELAVRLEAERRRLGEVQRPHIGSETVFVGQMHGGDFYNRFPTTCTMQGTRRYFADHSFDDVKTEFDAICRAAEAETGVTIDIVWDRIRDGYELPGDARVVEAFRRSYERIEGRTLEDAAFASVGDVSILAGEFSIPTVYCGNKGTGAHADLESLPIDDLVSQTRHLLGIVVEYFGLNMAGS